MAAAALWPADTGHVQAQLLAAQPAAGECRKRRALQRPLLLLVLLPSTAAANHRQLPLRAPGARLPFSRLRHVLLGLAPAAATAATAAAAGVAGPALRRCCSSLCCVRHCSLSFVQQSVQAASAAAAGARSSTTAVSTRQLILLLLPRCCCRVVRHVQRHQLQGGSGMCRGAVAPAVGRPLCAQHCRQVHVPALPQDVLQGEACGQEAGGAAGGAGGAVGWRPGDCQALGRPARWLAVRPWKNRAVPPASCPPASTRSCARWMYCTSCAVANASRERSGSGAGAASCCSRAAAASDSRSRSSGPARQEGGRCAGRGAGLRSPLGHGRVAGRHPAPGVLPPHLELPPSNMRSRCWRPCTGPAPVAAWIPPTHSLTDGLQVLERRSVAHAIAALEAAAAGGGAVVGVGRHVAQPCSRLQGASSRGSATVPEQHACTRR